jgi:hypothetical protein
MSQQGLRQASVRAESGTTLTYEGDWHAMWDGQSIAAGTFNERMLLYINEKLGVTYTNINDAMQALAMDAGATNFGSMGTFDASLTAGTGASILLGSETNGLAFSAVDDSMEIRDTVTPANNYVGSTITKFGAVRASAGLYYDVNGILQSSASGLRRDCDPRLSGTPKYLCEPAATNLCPYSQALATSPWAAFNVSVAVDQIAAPDGTVTADMLTVTSAVTPVVYNSFGAVAGTYTWSLYAKKGTARYALVSANDSVSNFWTWFDLNTGLVATNTAGNTAAMTNIGNGWFRCAVTRTVTNAFIGHSFGFVDVDNSTSGVVNQTGYAWGVTAELGSVATSYIPTTSASVTRAADIISTTAFNWQTATATLYAKYSVPDNSGTQYLFAQNVRAFELYLSSGTPTVYQDTLGLVTSGSTPAVLTTNKIAAAGAVNDFASSLNGAAVVTDATTSAMLAATTLVVGSRSNVNQLNGWIADGMHLPRRMTNAQLVTQATP